MSFAAPRNFQQGSRRNREKAPFSTDFWPTSIISKTIQLYTEWEQQRTSSSLISINRMCNRVPLDTRFNLQKLQSLNRREQNGGPFMQSKNRITSTWMFLRRETTRRSLIMMVVRISDLDAHLFRFVNFYRDHVLRSNAPSSRLFY